mgnify:CR=1 FL=1
MAQDHCTLHCGRDMARLPVSLNKNTCQQGPKKKVNEQKQISLNDAHTDRKSVG